MFRLSRLLDLIFPPRADETLVREAADDALAKRIDPSVIPIPDGNAVALLPYRDPLVKACIREAKYKGSAKACQMLGYALAEYLAQKAADEAAFAEGALALLPVPLSHERLSQRGYNQAERITACALSRLGLKDAPSALVLTRVRDTVSQAKLPRRERLANMKDAFAAQNVDTRMDYVVVDDVVTTGATLAAAVWALRSAGATRVSAIALAH